MTESQILIPNQTDGQLKYIHTDKYFVSKRAFAKSATSLKVRDVASCDSRIALNVITFMTYKPEKQSDSFCNKRAMMALGRSPEYQ